eukprot:TRINITY_DN2295_c0_g2_i2.p2 TRINITY_DN2295_c0_g2~~TRINITY_DN2295_c0_g2_i2.p2  ORF type:complete len:283 (+),score=72.74 TRINITY_DN2295_c0_g2_i2:248-1096(+)
MHLFNNMRHPHERLRKLSAKLLCKLAHNSCATQLLICKNFGFTPLSGRICINAVPEKIKELIRNDARIVKEIREGAKTKEGIYWTLPLYEKNELRENSIDFPDPLHYLIGFYAPDQKRPKPSAKLRQSAETQPRALRTACSLNSRALFTSQDPSCHRSFLVQRRSFKENVGTAGKGTKRLESVAEEEPPRRVLVIAGSSAANCRTIVVEGEKDRGQQAQKWGMTRIGKQLESETGSRVSSSRSQRRKAKTRKSQVASRGNTRRARGAKESLELKNSKRSSDI